MFHQLPLLSEYEALKPFISDMDSLWFNLAQSHSPANIEFFGTLSVQVCSFWAGVIILTSADVIGPSFLKSYKLQSLSKQPTVGFIWKCIPTLVQNQLLTTTLHFLQLKLLPRLTGKSTVYRFETHLPSIWEIVVGLVLCSIAREALFYYSHRIFHLPILYRHIHKVHHEFSAPTALAMQYAHPVEHIVSNIVPIAAPARIFKVHIITFWIFIVGSMVQGLLAHSGYDIRTIIGTKSSVHDMHHEFGNVNFGIIGFLDKIHGTDPNGRRKKRSQRVPTESFKSE
jgi:sterol desaturase/sphingolipid hydroxylase (fatty acid hydroxylase superfamily)